MKPKFYTRPVISHLPVSQDASVPIRASRGLCLVTKVLIRSAAVHMLALALAYMLALALAHMLALALAYRLALAFIHMLVLS